MKTEKKLEFVGIEVPENKKLIRTDMEKGVLFTFEEKEEEIGLFDFEKRYLIYNHTEKSVTPFKLFPQQQDLLDSIINNQYTVVKKYRQAGLSSVVSAYIASEISVGSGKHFVVLSPRNEMNCLLNNKLVGFTQQNRGLDLNIDFKYTPKRFEMLNNGNTIEFTTNMRGIDIDKVTHIFIDEADFVDEDILKLLVDSLNNSPAYIKVIIGSTPNPNKVNSYFRRLWFKNDSQLSKVDFKSYKDPRFDGLWFRDMLFKFNYDLVKFDIEINGNFPIAKVSQKESLDSQNSISEPASNKQVVNLTETLCKIIREISADSIKEDIKRNNEFKITYKYIKN